MAQPLSKTANRVSTTRGMIGDRKRASPPPAKTVYDVARLPAMEPALPACNHSALHADAAGVIEPVQQDAPLDRREILVDRLPAPFEEPVIVDDQHPAWREPRIELLQLDPGGVVGIG